MAGPDVQLIDTLDVKKPRRENPWLGKAKSFWDASRKRQLALVAAAALIAGGGIGAGVTAAATPAGDDTEEYHALEDRLASTVEAKDADIEEGREQLSTVRRQKDELQAAASDVQDREAAAAARETELATRETAVGAAEAAKKANEFGPGVHLVGTDIQPGQYRNGGSSRCYWARLSSTSGDIDAILANDNVDGQAIVSIAPTDVAFESSRCGTWTKIG